MRPRKQDGPRRPFQRPPERPEREERRARGERPRPAEPGGPQSESRRGGPRPRPTDRPTRGEEPRAPTPPGRAEGRPPRSPARPGGAPRTKPPRPGRRPAAERPAPPRSVAASPVVAAWEPVELPAGTGEALPFPYAAIRFPVALAVGQEIRLGRDAIEALRFRQVNVKEAFTVRDAAGEYFRASLRGAGPEGGEATVYERMAQSPEPPLRLSLCCAVLARQRMIFVSQKATELGIERLQPVLTERSVQAEGLEHEKAHAWPGQATRAAKQCRRASVPQVLPALPLADVLASELWRAAEARFYLDHGAPAPAALARGPISVCLAVGPEGGWTDAERGQLAAAGATPLVLGGRILRAETAVIAGLVLLQHHLGDLLAE